jgi:hypothetical protein
MTSSSLLLKAALVTAIATLLVATPVPARAAPDACATGGCAVCVDECGEPSGWEAMCEREQCDSGLPYCGQFGQCYVLTCNEDP